MTTKKPTNPPGEKTPAYYRKQGLRTPRQTNRRRNSLIFRLWMANTPVAEIARRKGLTPSAIYAIIKREQETRDGTASWIARAREERAFDLKVGKWRQKGRSFQWIRRTTRKGMGTIIEAWRRFCLSET